MGALVALTKKGVYLLIRFLVRPVEKMKQGESGSSGAIVDPDAKIFAPRLRMGYHCPWRAPR